MKWDSLHVTNVLLLIIGVLMLVMVASQPKNDRPRYAAAPNVSDMGSVPAPTGAQPNPHANVPMGQNTAPADDNFNFQNMIYAALECPEDPTLTLADFGCDGDTATERRTYVKAIYDQGLPPRALFDEIIATYGEEALTDEAKEIRRNNRAGK